MFFYESKTFPSLQVDLTLSSKIIQNIVKNKPTTKAQVSSGLNFKIKLKVFRPQGFVGGLFFKSWRFANCLFASAWHWKSCGTTRRIIANKKTQHFCSQTFWKALFCDHDFNWKCKKVADVEIFTAEDFLSSELKK